MVSPSPLGLPWSDYISISACVYRNVEWPGFPLPLYMMRYICVLWPRSNAHRTRGADFALGSLLVILLQRPQALLKQLSFELVHRQRRIAAPLVSWKGQPVDV